MIKVYYRVAPK